MCFFVSYLMHKEVSTKETHAHAHAHAHTHTSI